jgi:diguanylate cyclase (GGDEF)-like protein
MGSSAVAPPPPDFKWDDDEPKAASGFSWDDQPAPAASQPQAAPVVQPKPAGQLPNGTLSAAPEPGYLQRVGENVRNSAVGRALGMEPTLHEGAEQREAASSVPSPLAPTSAGGLLPEWAAKPLPEATDLIPGFKERQERQVAEFSKAHPILGGIAAGIHDTGESLRTPANVALLLAAPELKLLSALFAAQAAHGAYTSAEEAYQAFRQGKNAEAAKFATESGLNAIIAGWAGTHAARGSFPVDTARPAVTEPSVEVPTEPRQLGAGPQPEYQAEPPAPPQPEGIQDAEFTWDDQPKPQAQLPASGGPARNPVSTPPPPVNPNTAVSRTVPPQFAPRPQPEPDRGVIVDPQGNALVSRPGLPVPVATANRKTPIIPKPAPTPEQVAPSPQMGSQAVMAKPVMHVTNDVEALRDSAERLAPKIGDAVSEAAKNVPGAKLEAVRDSKDTDRIEDKAERQGVQPSQIGDIAAAKVTVPDQASAEQVLQNLNGKLPVEKVEGSIDGEPGKNGVQQVQAIVDTQAPGEPVQKAEVLIQTPEMAAATDSTHSDYRKAQELRAQGKDAEADKIENQIQQVHEEAQKPPADVAERGNALKVGDAIEYQTNKGKTRPGKILDIKGDRAQVQDKANGFSRVWKALDSLKPSNQGAKQEVAQQPEQQNQPVPAQVAQTGTETPQSAHGAKPIGEPLNGEITDLVKQRIAQKLPVKIFSRRLADDPTGANHQAVDAWIQQHFGTSLPLTDTKTAHDGAIYDDSSNVEHNTGRILSHSTNPGDEGKPILVDLDGTLARSAPHGQTDANTPPGAGTFQWDQPERRATPATGPRQRRDLATRPAIESMKPEEMARELAELRGERTTDELTGVGNLRGFKEAQAKEKAPAVAASDSDGMAAFNDRFGHAAGDELLKAKASALKQAGLEAYRVGGDEFLYRGTSDADLKAKLDKAREILRNTVFDLTMKDGTTVQLKGVDFSYGTGADVQAADKALYRHKDERTAQGERAPKGSGQFGRGVEIKPREPEKREGETKFKFGNTQADIPADSEAARAIEAIQKRIDPADLAGDVNGTDGGMETQHHITVRYGIKGEDTAGIRAYLEQQKPFEARLGVTAAFPASEHSDGAVPIIVPVESINLRDIEKELDKHGDFKERSFPEYKPHATVAYVKPEAAQKYVGLPAANGKTFTVTHISITGRDGEAESIQLKGKANAEPRNSGQPRAAHETEGGREDALQKPSPEKLLPRQQEETGGTGSERRGVGPGDEGEGAASKGESQAPLEQPKEEVKKPSFYKPKTPQVAPLAGVTPLGAKPVAKPTEQADKEETAAEVTDEKDEPEAKDEEEEEDEPTKEEPPKKPDLGGTFYAGFADPALFKRLFPDVADKIAEWVSDEPTTADEQKAMMRETRGQMDRRVAIAMFKLKDASRQWRGRSREDSKKFWNAVETGAHYMMSPEDQALAEVFKNAFDQMRHQLQQLKPEVLQNYIENYFPHIWERPASVASTIKGLLTGKKPFAGKASFLKRRTIPTMQDGLDMGLTPKSWNPVDSFLLKYAEMAQFLMAHQTLEVMKQAGTGRYFRLSQKAPDGWKQLDDRIGTVYRRIKALDEDKLEDVTQPLTYPGGKRKIEGAFSEDIEDATHGEIALVGHYYAPADAAKVFNRYVSRGIAGRSNIYDTLRWLNDNMNALQLGVSAFHATTISVVGAASDLALGIQKLSEGKPVEAGMSLARVLAIPVSIFNTVRNGSKLMAEYLSPGSYRSLAKEAGAVSMAGGRIKQNVVEIKPLDKAINAFRNGALLEGLSAVPGAVLHGLTAPVMEYYVPRMKLGIFYGLAHDILDEAEKHNWDQGTVRLRMDEAWNSVDNRAGQMVYDNLFWQKGVRDVLQLATRSVGWNYGSYAEAFGALTGTVRAAGNIAQGKRARVTPSMAFALALPMVTALIGGSANYLRTGKAPETYKDYFYVKNADGTYLNIPGYMKDVFSFAHDPLGTVANKLGPLWQATTEAVENKDFYGTEIRHKDDPAVKQLVEVAEWAAKQTIPFSFSGAGKLLEDQGAEPNLSSMLQVAAEHPEDVLISQLGFQQAPAFIQHSKALNMARAYGQANRPSGTKTKQQADRQRAMHAIEDMYRHKKVDQKTIDHLRKSGVISMADLMRAKLYARTDPLVGSVKSLTPEQALNVYEAGTDAEKKTLRPLMEEKSRTLIRETDPEKRQELKDAYRNALHGEQKFVRPIV